MRTSEGAFAYIVRTGSMGGREYLLQWNPGWDAYNFVGGRVEPPETFRDCCVREIYEELEIQEHIGYYVAARPLAHLEYTAYSESARQETAYVFELYETRLTPSALAQVSANPINRWVSLAEILAGRTADGRGVSKTVAQILNRSGLVKESDPRWNGKGHEMARYIPRPLNIESVQLPESLLKLTEQLAEHIHDTWAAQRLKEGWVYGPERDDAKKLHPCLVPYAELPEIEKEYDRNTALGTLRAIVLLGYRIENQAPGGGT